MHIISIRDSSWSTSLHKIFISFVSYIDFNKNKYYYFYIKKNINIFKFVYFYIKKNIIINNILQIYIMEEENRSD